MLRTFDPLDTSRIDEYVKTGRGNRYYYEECEAKLRELFGHEARLMAKFLAATSMNNAMVSNVHMARKAMVQYRNGNRFSGYMPTVIMYLNLAAEDKEFPGRKTNAFWKAMTGDRYAVVVDFWILYAFGYSNKSPSKKQYDRIEKWIRQEALNRDLDPRQLQAMIWVGVRQDRKGPQETNFSTVMERTLNNLFNVI